MPKPEDNPGHGHNPDKPHGKPPTEPVDNPDTPWDESAEGGTPTNMFGTYFEGVYTNVLYLMDGTQREQIAYGEHAGEIYPPGTFIHAPLPPADTTGMYTGGFNTTHDGERICIGIPTGTTDEKVLTGAHTADVHPTGTFTPEPLPAPE